MSYSSSASPPNIRMVLASTPDTIALDKLAELADKVLQVATPTGVITTVTNTLDISTEVEHL